MNQYCSGSQLQVAEVGTSSGRTSAHLLKYCPQISRIYAIDLRKPDPSDDWVTHLERVTFIQGYSHLCARRIEDESLDLVFLDADHSEDAVFRDLEAWVPKVKPGGVISGHDYGSHNNPGVKNAVDVFFASHPHPISIEANKVWWTLR